MKFETILVEIAQRRTIYRQEAQDAIKEEIQSYLTKHPIIAEVSWSHGDMYNDETFDFTFDNLSFMLEQPLHNQMQRQTVEWEDWRDSGEKNRPYAVVARRWEKQQYKDASEFPEAYADGKLAAAIADLLVLNEKFREFDAELMEIFAMSEGAGVSVKVTRERMICDGFCY